MECLQLKVVHVLPLVGHKVLNGREHLRAVRTVNVGNVFDLLQVVFVISDVHRFLSAHGTDELSVDKADALHYAARTEFVAAVQLGELQWYQVAF